MNHLGILPGHTDLSYIKIKHAKNIYWNLTPAELTEHALANHEGTLTDTGALMVDTGEFTGRAPEDKFWVKDPKTEKTLWWGDVNHGIDVSVFEKISEKMAAYTQSINLYIRDVYACAHPDYKIKIRVITETAFHNLFTHNMFLRPTVEETSNFEPEYTILCCPGFQADPQVDGTRSKNFAIINLSKKQVLIGGTGYTGEIKKGIFSILNYLLPHEHGTLSMHSSANIGIEGDTAVFFGLSGTGKTTLSADPNRQLIGDDEHGWTDTGVFNFEGGCYAKAINLSKEQEPEIWNAIRFGALLENTRYYPNTRTVDFANTTVTLNTRVSYPLYHIANRKESAMGGIPKNIFFLAADAFGILPPLSKLSAPQAMYHFISGYTSKVAGTEMGVNEPKAAFSACFGAPFLPLHPTVYAQLLGEKMKKYNVHVWLINTGWTGGAYGVGTRMKLQYTRAMITAVFEGRLTQVNYHAHPIFGINIPTHCPGVPQEILDPRNTWNDKKAYDLKATELAEQFVKNFEKYKSYANDEIMSGAPVC
ncbi:MAG: phosphoenolpyruvate carboxykinase (ATP) [Cytophagales bacterium]|nr:phosphoenolpyruvate carboxykinase (ATP) [Cytophagales bacterium]